MTKDEALKLALEALETCGDDEWHTDDDYGMTQVYDDHKVSEAITAIKEALAQPAQEPASVTYQEVAKTMNLLWWGTSKEQQIAKELEGKKLYTTPPQRPWVGLTDEERHYIALGIEVFGLSVTEIFLEVEAKLKEKNT